MPNGAGSRSTGAQVAIIGAGSMEFASRLIADMLTFDNLRTACFVLWDVDARRLELAGRITRRLLREGGYGEAACRIATSLDDAVAGADAVISSILVGGYAAIEAEIDIPARYGIDQCIGDTLGPGGVMRCLRTLPAQVDIVRAMRRHCPDAWLLNYTNPMSMLCWGMEAAEPGAKVVGLCHSVQGTTRQWARRLDVPIDEVAFACIGINHQAWIVRFEHRGTDLLPRIRDLAVQPAVWQRDSSRMEYVKHFGYPVTESSGHNSEYSAWFRKRPDLLAAYCPGGGWNGGSGFIKTLYHRPDWEATLEAMAEGRTPFDFARSIEFGAAIVSALRGGAPTLIHGNVTNRGAIANLPADACVEVPCRVDALGVQPLQCGALPDHLAAINQAQIGVQRLAVRAALDGDPEKVFQAIALDPLSAAVGSLDALRAMTGELLAAHAPWLPAPLRERRLASRPVLAQFGSGAGQ